MAHPETHHHLNFEDSHTAIRSVATPRRPLSAHPSSAPPVPFMGYNPQDTSVINPTYPRTQHVDNMILADSTYHDSTTYDFSAGSLDTSNYQTCQQPLSSMSNEPLNQTVHSRLSHGIPYVRSYQTEWGSPNNDFTCPRSYPDLDLLGSMGSMTDAYPPSAYQLEPVKQQSFQSMHGLPDRSSAMALDEPFDAKYEPHSLAENNSIAPTSTPQIQSSISRPGSADVAMPQSAMMSPTDSMKLDLKPENDDEPRIEREQPYAKLIFRALMDAPNHTMVLRDIYDWFRRNTTRGRDNDTKGWQNSIRHNLSMNAAFRKVEPPAGQESRKGFLWRLDERALIDGVKSTTRYRPKASKNKRTRRSLNPAPQRQASGAKGGQAARKSARLRRSERLRLADIDERHMNGITGSMPRSSGMWPSPSEHSMDYPTSPSMPYFLPHTSVPQWASYQTQQARPATPYSTSTGMSTPGTPDEREYIHMLPLSNQQSLFYGSTSESGGDEPMTPSSFSDMQSLQLDPNPFFDTDMIL